jgi:TRAP-type C4-dicarboxylate transport system permease small subunit
MFTRLAKYMDKVVSYPSNLMSVAGMVAMTFVMVLVVASVLLRRFFDLPIRGSSDLVILGFSVMVWGPMAMAAIKRSHIALTALLDRFPRLVRLWFDLIIALSSAVILGLVSWRLIEYGISLTHRLYRTGNLHIPYGPFLYVAGACVALMALVFLARVPEAVGKLRGEQ